MQKKGTAVLIVLDGFGYSEEEKYNAIAAANTPQWDAWLKTKPWTLLDASGTSVGLPSQQMGNSEVGHMHIGAGRVIPQDFTRINEAIENGKFFNNPQLLTPIKAMKAANKAIHVMGLLSPGGVHSHEEHLFAFLKLCHQYAFNKVFLHLFLDGRDTPPQSALASIEKLKQILNAFPVGRIASITGRYYAMDRDKRWDRVAPVYKLLTESSSPYPFENATDAILHFYQEHKFDEFIPPTLIGPKAPIEDGDSIFFFNFRSDRARQLTAAFIDPTFDGFSLNKKPVLSHFLSMTSYAKHLNTEIVFPKLTLTNTLGEVIANAGLSQLRIAETEKYAHVTFFFNGGSEQVFAKEDRILIPSPQVLTYDLCPEMSALSVTEAIVQAINTQSFDVIICNFANADMVGHTGNIEATIKAIECLDKCMHTIAEALIKKGGSMLITADHGNAESMYNDTIHQAHTAHTSHPVPLVYIGSDHKHFSKSHGSLVDVAPTFLSLLNIEKPQEMTGKSLLMENHED